MMAANMGVEEFLLHAADIIGREFNKDVLVREIMYMGCLSDENLCVHCNNLI